jgi:hypothetical protein
MSINKTFVVSQLKLWMGSIHIDNIGGVIIRHPCTPLLVPNE